MVEGSTTNRKRDNGVAMKILKTLFGESLTQWVFRIILSILTIHLLCFDHYIGSASGFVMLVFLIIGSSWKNEKVIFFNKLQQVFFSNKAQKEFMDVFVIMLWLATVFPANYCKSIKTCVQYLHEKIPAFTIIGYNVDFVDIEVFHFILWDIVVIIMSIILAYSYQKEIFSTIDEDHKKNNFAEKVRKKNNSNNLCFFLMICSIVCFLFKIYVVALPLLAWVAWKFINNDRWLIDFFEAILKAQKDNKLQQRDHRIAKRLNQTRESLYFANIPAFAGLVLLFSIAFIIEYKAIILGNKPGISLTAFIAGGSAMHMVFGNLVVLVCLREDGNLGGVI